MATNVYLSIGRPSDERQANFSNAIARYLQANQLNPQTAGFNYFDSQQPLKSVRDCMKDCSGTIVVAYERTSIVNGIERVGAPDERYLNDVKLPTIWNHMEGAMAIALGKPLLVLCEEGLKEEGVVEDKYEEWRVSRIPIDKNVFGDQEFVAKFEFWRKQVEAHRAQESAAPSRSSFDPASITIAELIKSLRPAQLWAVLGAFALLVGGGMTLAYKIGAIAAGQP